MSCGRCARAVTAAIQGLDPGAEVEVDLARREVAVGAASAGPEALACALREAGYPPERLPVEA